MILKLETPLNGALNGSWNLIDHIDDFHYTHAQDVPKELDEDIGERTTIRWENSVQKNWYVVLNFTRFGKRTQIYSSLTVFLLNDDGKTIEKLN